MIDSNPRMDALLSDIPINLSLVSGIISKLDCHKTSGCDRISAAVLKEYAPSLKFQLISPVDQQEIIEGVKN